MATGQRVQQRRRVRQGSSQLCTWRSARGQDNSLRDDRVELMGTADEVPGA